MGRPSVRGLARQEEQLEICDVKWRAIGHFIVSRTDSADSCRAKRCSLSDDPSTFQGRWLHWATRLRQTIRHAAAHFVRVLAISRAPFEALLLAVPLLLCLLLLLARAAKAGWSPDRILRLAASES